ncbi:HEAT repeat domain-containing protein [Myxococcus sp. K15C18031901]|uniref:aldo/keto reductase n=1 Tax=Myxococcus dinghuensis TaxID=2906761 RepID=UPI0020A7643F|nr:aldo/keto reductase [Myxococcus dinghuensis]MCP3103701.1 HEAT repeat domain-containing protein [Myxococcus dinghuensis]
MPALDLATVRLLDEDVAVRREAAARVDASLLSGRYALRQALLSDEDAEVRATAARQLGAARDTRFIPGLIDALADPMPLVRDRVWRALARLGAREVLPHAARAVRDEAVWWVRRAAVRASATLAGADALGLLMRALEDPFWRVRHAAVQALALLGAEDAALQGEVRREAAEPRHARGPVRPAVAWLEVTWKETRGYDGAGATAQGEHGAIPGSGVDLSPSLGGLGSEDPAVTTARLEAMAASEVPPRDLVEWLGDPHEPLRHLARRRLRERDDPDTLLLALRWLDEPRVPHAQDEARALLERVDVGDVDLATRILASPPRPGVVSWAARVAVKKGDEPLLARVRTLATHPEPAVRRAALSALVHDPASRSTVLGALDDVDETVREEVIAAWERRPPSSAAARDYAAALLAFAPRATTPRERRAVTSAAALLQDSDTLLRALRDEDVPVQATALEVLAALDLLSDTEREHAASQDDPWLRAAVLDPTTARHACTEDPDPTLRRIALERVLAHARSNGPDASESQLSVFLACAHAPDPWMRARAAEHLLPEDGTAALHTLLRLSRDAVPMVRAAVAASLEACEALDPLLESLLRGDAPHVDEDVRLAAWTWRLRQADLPAFEALRAALDAGTEPPRVVAHLETQLLVFPAAFLEPRPDLARRRPRAAPRTAPATTPRRQAPLRDVSRPLGSTGIQVSPLVLSGAHLATRDAFFEAHDAGLRTYFWEPRYETLTRFLQGGRGPRDQNVVVAGSYHAGAAALRRDVESALRRLRTSWLDVFLLFWVRAPERLSDEDFTALERLRAEGKVRAFGFSTHLRDLARDALARHPWPVVMTRHSAAHPGAEGALFPDALRRGTGLLTFTATCYGRLLQPVPGMAPEQPLPTAVDCYRYSLSQPGVSATLTAPRNARELRHNLEVLSRPWMEPDALPAMRAHGERVRDRTRRLDALVRRAPGGPRDALLALLEEPLPPTEDDLSSPRGM